MAEPEVTRRSMGRILPGAGQFIQEFVAFAGRKGLFAGLFMGLGALVDGIGLVLIIPLLDIVLDSRAEPPALQAAAATLFHAAGAENPVSRLALLLLLFTLLMIVRAAVISVRDVTLARLRVGFVESFRGRIAERLAAARWEQVTRLRHARVTHVLSGDIQRIGTAAFFALQSTVAVTMLLVQCVLALLLAPPLAMIAFGLLAVSAAALVPVLRRARKLGGFVTRANLTLLNATSHFLGGLKLAISQNLQQSFVAEFNDTLRELTAQQITYLREQTNARLAIATLSAIVGGALVLIGFGLFHISAPILIALLLIIARMNGPANQIQQGAQQLAHALPAYDEIKQLERELTGVRAGQPVCSGKAAASGGPIVFDKVSFSHVPGGEQPDGVRDLSVTIRPGEFVGISGPSGAGKTTFADLLVGLIPPQQGQIRIGEYPLDDTRIAGWREGISYVSQDPFLFHDTVRRNLSWARPSASEEEMWTALAVAGVEGLVRRMTRGLDTIVGERGTLVSGGERQRIALARALLRRPRLLVLDEATSAIDVAGEHVILEKLRALTPRPTIVLIAHRAESLVECDRVLWMEAGRLSDPGLKTGPQRR